MKQHKMSLITKISYIACFLAMGSVFVYGIFVMDGRTTMNSQDRTYMSIMLVVLFTSLIFMIADRAKSRGGEFSWKKFGIIIILVVLFGLWRLTV
jgi:hypothetical protein